MSRTRVKPYLEGFNEFIIEKLKLVPNAYTRNDFLYFRVYGDVQVMWNPRCQMLDFNPPENKKHSDKYSYQEYIELLSAVSRFWEDLAMSFFLQTGKNPSQFIIVRLYGIKAKEYGPNLDKVEYITYLCGDEKFDWTPIEGWPEIAKKFLRKRYFRFACFGSEMFEDGYRGKPRPTKKDDKHTEKVRNRHRKRGISHTKKHLIPMCFKQGVNL